MSLATPIRRVLVIASDPAASDELCRVLACDPEDWRGPLEIDAVRHGSEGSEKVAQSLQGGRPYALALIDANAPDPQAIDGIVNIWRADPNLQMLLCADAPDLILRQILSRTQHADRLWMLKKPLDPAQTRQLVDVLTRAWQCARSSELRAAQLEQTIQAERAQRQRFEEELRLSQDRFALAVAGSNDGIWDWNLADGQVFYSPRWKAILGFADDEIAGTMDEWFKRIHPDDLHRVEAELDSHLDGKTDRFRCEYRLRHKDGSDRWVLTQGVAVRDESGVVRRVAGSQTEITDRKLAEEQLRHDALHDPLTGLANRPLLLDRMNHCLASAQRTPNYLFAVLFLDVDRFKVINDSLGHDAGDQLLVEIATRIMTVVRSMDMVARVEPDHLARFGGDEFVLLLDGLSQPEDAVRVAERLLKALQEPFKFGRHDVFTSVSIGIAFGSASSQRPETVLRDADAALHAAKTDRKQRYRIYNPDMHARAMRHLAMEGEMRQAIDRGQLRLHYQPIHSLSTGKIVEFETLVRWQHPERGLIPPAEFIPMAEETGLIIPVGRWVLRTACRQLAQWDRQEPAMADVGIGVNVSSRQFLSTDLVSDVREALAETSLRPQRISLEITEGAIMESGAPALNILPALHALGVRLHLDDFGTGYSSLGYLNQMPIDVLKIDRSFVSRICTAKTGLSLVQAIIALARSLNMQVIAEGVESEQQVAILTGMGCDYVQGFYFASALAPDKAVEYWKRYMNSIHLPLNSGISSISEAV